LTCSYGFEYSIHHAADIGSSIPTYWVINGIFIRFSDAIIYFVAGICYTLSPISTPNDKNSEYANKTVPKFPSQ
jgi:hypothetical protein